MTLPQPERVPEEHAQYDAGLIHLHQGDRRFFWTGSTLTTSPATKADYDEHARRRLREGLQKLGCDSQDASRPRHALRHIAHLAVRDSAALIHGRQCPVEALLHSLRDDVRAIAEPGGGIVLDDDADPLWAYGRPCKGEGNDGSPMYGRVVSATTDDRRLAQSLLQGDQLEQLLRTSVPHLLEVDDDQLIIALPEVRQKLSDLLQGHSEFDDERREACFKVISEAWGTAIPDFEDRLRAVRQEALAVELECKRRERGKIHSTNQQRSRRVQEEMQKAIAEFPDAFTSPTGDLIARYIEPLLQGTCTEATQRELQKRFVVLEFLVTRLIDEEHWEDLQLVLVTFKRINDRWPLPWYAFPTLGLAHLAAATRGLDVNLETFKGYL